MEHKHSVYDTDTHFVIVKDTRGIKCEAENLPMIVQHDHNSERFSFLLDRLIDGHDMTQCNQIKVHYINIDSSTKDTAKGVYEVDDIALFEGDDSKAVCSWLISENATRYAGKLNFKIEFACVADDGTVTYRWNTAIYSDVNVSNGIDNGEVVTETFPDILAQWEAGLFGIGDTEEQRLLDVSAEQQAAITAEGQKQVDAIAGKGAAVNASIPADYSALSALADHNRRNKAGAIVLNAEGESIVLNDASEYPVTGLKLFGKSEQLKTTGKNLLDVSTENAMFVSGYNKYTLENGTIAITGESLFTFKMPVAYGTTYTFSLNKKTTESTCHFRVYEYKDAPVAMLSDDPNYVSTPINSSCAALDRVVKQYTPSAENITWIAVGFYTTQPNVVTNFQAELGTEATEYEPYTGGAASPSPEYPQEINSVENAVVTVCGKNLIPPTTDTFTGQGITSSPAITGTVMLNGTATIEMSRVVSKGVILTPGEYTLSVYGLNVEDTNHDRVFVTNSNGAVLVNYVMTGKTATFTIAESTTAQVAIVFAADSSYSNAIVSVQLESGSMATEFESYKAVQTVTIPHALPGIPVSGGGNYTDANGQQWICDEVDLARGVYVQRIGYTEYNGSEGEEIYTYGLKNNTFEILDNSVNYLPVGSSENVANVLSNRYTPTSALSIYQRGTNGTIAASTSGRSVRVAVDSCAGYTTDEFRAWLAQNPFEVHYILSKPTETPLTDAEITAYKALCTNKPNTTILNDAGAYMAVEYVADTKIYIDNKIAELMAQ